MQNINRVIMTGNLTRDPELLDRNGTKVCRLRIACNGRVKQQGEWVDKANYFDVTCFGAQAENVNKYLSKGRALALDGRLDWREWTTDSNEKRQAVQIIADSIQFLQDGSGPSERREEGDGGVATSSAPPADDDIPF